MTHPEHADDASLRRVLERDFDVERLGRARLAVHPRTRIGSSGVLRLLIPRAFAVVSGDLSKPRVVVRPDGLAIFMCIVCIGCLVVEATMDRVRYPREYPAAFVYAVAAWFLSATFVVVARTRRAVGIALRRTAGG